MAAVGRVPVTVIANAWPGVWLVRVLMRLCGR